MIIGWSGQNLAHGGARFRIAYTSAVSTLVANELITGGTSGGVGRIERIDTTNAVIIGIAVSGVIEASETITGSTSSATATVSTISSYVAPVSSLLSSTTSPTTGYAEDTQNLSLARSASWTISASGSAVIDIDRGASWNAAGRQIGDPDGVWLSAFTAEYDFYNNSCNLSSVVIYGDSASNFATATTLATVTDGSPTDGPGVFGQGQIYASLSSGAFRYIRVEFNAGGSDVTVSVGNIWISESVDTLTDEAWNFKEQFASAMVDRSFRTETAAGAESVRARTAQRRFRLTASRNAASWDRLLDALRGSQSAYTNQTMPIAVCLDPLNVVRDVTGQHLMSGLFRLPTNIEAMDTGARRNGVYFQPDINMELIEWRG